MREKLIELLGNVYLPMMAGPSAIGEYRIPHKFKKEIADHLIANGVVISNSETATKWIPVTERLPEQDGPYLCIYHFGEYPRMTFTQVLDYYATDIVPHFQHTFR